MSCRGFEPVCTNQFLRDNFAKKGLSYSDITDDDIFELATQLRKEIKHSNKIGETSVNTMKLSQKIDIKRDEQGKLLYCFLYMNSHYFTRRECVSFNRDGFIGFAGWADDGNTNPIRRAFLRWCVWMSERKQSLANKTSQYKRQSW